MPYISIDIPARVLTQHKFISDNIRTHCLEARPQAYILWITKSQPSNKLFAVSFINFLHNFIYRPQKNTTYFLRITKSVVQMFHKEFHSFSWNLQFHIICQNIK